MSAFEDDSKCAMSYQVLPTKLEFPHRLHVERSVFPLKPGSLTGRAQVSLVSGSFLLCEAEAAAGMFSSSFTCHGLASQCTVPFSHVRTKTFRSGTPTKAVNPF